MPFEKIAQFLGIKSSAPKNNKWYLDQLEKIITSNEVFLYEDMEIKTIDGIIHYLHDWISYMESQSEFAFFNTYKATRGDWITSVGGKNSFFEPEKYNNFALEKIWTYVNDKTSAGSSNSSKIRVLIHFAESTYPIYTQPKNIRRYDLQKLALEKINSLKFNNQELVENVIAIKRKRWTPSNIKSAMRELEKKRERSNLIEKLSVSLDKQNLKTLKEIECLIVG